MSSFSSDPSVTQGIPSALRDFLRVVFFLGALCFITAVILIGVERISDLFFPKLAIAAYSLMAIFVLIIYPLSRWGAVRRVLIVPTFLLASLLAASAWGYALLFVMTALGIWGVLCCFFFQVLTPIAIIGALFKGRWEIVGNLALWLMVSYLMKFFSVKLGLEAVMPKRKGQDRVIDVEATLQE